MLSWGWLTEARWNIYKSLKCRMILQWLLPLPSLYPSSRLWRQFATLVWCPMWSSLPLPSWSDYTSPAKWALRSRKEASACLLTSRPWWCTGVHGELATAGWFVVGDWLKIVSLYVATQWDFDLRSFVPWPFVCKSRRKAWESLVCDVIKGGKGTGPWNEPKFANELLIAL